MPSTNGISATITAWARLLAIMILRRSWRST